jgi:hypothetical protein
VVLFDDQKFNQIDPSASIGLFSGHFHMFGPFVCQSDLHMFVPTDLLRYLQPIYNEAMLYTMLRWAMASRVLLDDIGAMSVVTCHNIQSE